MCGGSKDGSWIDRELQLARNVWNQQESLPEYPEDPEVGFPPHTYLGWFSSRKLYLLMLAL